MFTIHFLHGQKDTDRLEQKKKSVRQLDNKLHRKAVFS